MQTLTNVSSPLGAPFGRVERSGEPAAHRFTLQRVRINSGGYDAGGAYWGRGAPLYWACSDDGTAERFFRADDRAEAKATIQAEYPGARFYR